MHLRPVLLTTLALACFATRARAEECPDGEGKAKCLIANAQAQTDPREAAKLYLASYRVDPKMDALTGYGSSLEAAKDFVGGSEALEKAVEGYKAIEQKMQESNADATQISALQHRIEYVQDELKKMSLNVSKVQLKVTGTTLPPNVASVTRKGGDDIRPSTPTRLIIHPGGDTLIFTFTDGKTLEKSVNLSPGTLSTLEIPDEPKAVIVAPHHDDTPAQDTGGSQRTSAYITGTIGIVLLGSGIGYGAATSSPSLPLTAVLVGLGGAGLGASVVFYLWGDSKRKPTSSAAALVPVVNGNMIGAVFTGTL